MHFEKEMVNFFLKNEALRSKNVTNNLDKQIFLHIETNLLPD